MLLRGHLHKHFSKKNDLPVYFLTGLYEEDNMSGDEQFNNDFFKDHRDRICGFNLLNVNVFKLLSIC